MKKINGCIVVRTQFFVVKECRTMYQKANFKKRTRGYKNSGVVVRVLRFGFRVLGFRVLGS